MKSYILFYCLSGVNKLWVYSWHKKQVSKQCKSGLVVIFFLIYIFLDLK